MIDPAFRARAAAALAEVERAEGVRVLLAVESGSRAWGFASRDSDYDVRFVYLRPLAGYLSVVPARDVLERPLEGLLDLGGWDVRKALGLLARGNAVALEWLGSPVVYRQDPTAVELLRGVARAAAHPPAAHCRPAAADRLRERRQSVARARRGPPAGTRPWGRCRRRPRRGRG